MFRSLARSLSALAGGVRAHLLKIGGYGFVSATMAVGADVLGGSKPIVWGAAALAGALAVVCFLGLWIGMVGHVRRASASGELGPNLSFFRDATLFAGMTAGLMALTGAGQHFFAKPEQPSIFAQILEAISKGKQETSKDPRKELANLGVQWSTQTFIDAMMDGDERLVRLFLEGGMSATTNHRGTSAVVYILQPGVEKAPEMLDLLIAHGYDVNATLVDPVIMRKYGQSMPPHFEANGLPEEYAAWQRTFAGPAILWVTIRSAYAGPKERDRKIVERLRKAGANLDLSRAFIMAMHKSWGDTTSHQQAAMMLK